MQLVIELYLIQIEKAFVQSSTILTLYWRELLIPCFNSNPGNQKKTPFLMSFLLYFDISVIPIKICKRI